VHPRAGLVSESAARRPGGGATLVPGESSPGRRAEAGPGTGADAPAADERMALARVVDAALRSLVVRRLGDRPGPRPRVVAGERLRTLAKRDSARLTALAVEGDGKGLRKLLQTTGPRPPHWWVDRVLPVAASGLLGDERREARHPIDVAIGMGFLLLALRELTSRARRPRGLGPRILLTTPAERRPSHRSYELLELGLWADRLERAGWTVDVEPGLNGAELARQTADDGAVGLFLGATVDPPVEGVAPGAGEEAARATWLGFDGSLPVPGHAPKLGRGRPWLRLAAGSPIG